MKNTKITKSKYFISWLIFAWLIMWTWVFASTTWAGTIWSLFKKVGSDYRLMWDNIENNTIDSSEIEDNTLTSDDLWINSVWNSELQDNSIWSSKIIDWTIREEDLDPNLEIWVFKKNGNFAYYNSWKVGIWTDIPRAQLEVQTHDSTIPAFMAWYNINYWVTPWISSVAMWYKTKASWSGSFVVWYESEASWNYSTAIWYKAKATTFRSVVIWHLSGVYWSSWTAIWSRANALWISSLAIHSWNAHWTGSVAIWWEALWRDSLAIFWKAIWYNSISLWSLSTASWSLSTALWYYSTVNWNSSTAIWFASTANWSTSTALWYYSIANWNNSLAMWNFTEANWEHSLAMIWWKTYWDGSVAMWNFTEANWDRSVAIWYDVKATWRYSMAMWHAIEASWDNSVIFWKNGQTDYDDVLAVAYGYYGAENTAWKGLVFQVKRNGNVYAVGKVYTNNKELATKEYVDSKINSSGWNSDNIWNQNGSDIYYGFWKVWIWNDTPEAQLEVQTHDSTIPAFMAWYNINYWVTPWKSSVATWYKTIADWDYSVAMWWWTKASWDYSFAIGQYSEASSDESIAIWRYNNANWWASTALWQYTEASWQTSITMWDHTKASWNTSTAMWRKTIASWSISTAIWSHTTASAYASTIVWKNGQTNSNDVFSVAYGSSGDENTAWKWLVFRVERDWNIYADKTFHSYGADYAEYFEFDKGEKFNIGDIVWLNLETWKVRIYQVWDELIGIISEKPSVLGNTPNWTEKDIENWKKTHIIVGLVWQLDFNKEQVNIKWRLVYTKDGKKVWLLLNTWKILIK